MRARGRSKHREIRQEIIDPNEGSATKASNEILLDLAEIFRLRIFPLAFFK